MGSDFDFGHSKGSKMHFFYFWSRDPVKTAGDASVFKNKFFLLIDLGSLPIVTTNFDEYESKSAFCPYKGQATAPPGPSDSQTTAAESLKAANTANAVWGTFSISGEHFGPKFTLFC